MSTRSTIALEYDDGSIKVIYCHYDGYLKHVGKTLFEYYNDSEKLNTLISLGNLSNLGPDIGSKHSFEMIEDSSWTDEELKAAWNDYHSVCTFYGRDRGDRNVSAKQFKDYDTYLEWLSSNSQEYNYYRAAHGAWYVKQYGAWSLLKTLIRIDNFIANQKTG